MNNCRLLLKVSIACIVILITASGCNNIIIRPHGCRPPHSYQLPGFKLIPQMAFNWCWAASGEMCMDYLTGYNQPICQCRQADDYCQLQNVVARPSGGCCAFIPADQQCDPNNGYFLYPANSPCNQPEIPNFRYGGFMCAPPTINKALSFHDLQTEIYCNGRPVIFSWTELVGGAPQATHIMVAYGYSVQGTTRLVYVRDPAQSINSVPYSEYVQTSDHQHANDYYGIVKVGPGPP